MSHNRRPHDSSSTTFHTSRTSSIPYHTCQTLEQHGMAFILHITELGDASVFSFCPYPAFASVLQSFAARDARPGLGSN